MAFVPRFSIRPQLLAHVEHVAAMRERIQASAVELSWIPALQKDARSRTAHASTAIEGNPLTLEQVRALEEGRELSMPTARAKREVINYFAGLRFVEKNAKKPVIARSDVLALHKILAGKVMDQGEPGKYRTIEVRVGLYRPPRSNLIPGLMADLLAWWNGESKSLSPVLSSAILHYQFEAIHPFADGNGRTGRALALWELYRRGFDTHHIFAVDEYFWEDRKRYYMELDRVHRQNEDLTDWLEYCAEGLHQSLERAWLRIKAFSTDSPIKLTLRPKQEQLLHLLKDHGSMAPKDIWQALGVSRQGAMDLLNPLLDAGLVVKLGSKKSGRYALARP